MHEKMFAELKATKIVLEVPSLRDQYDKKDRREKNFNSFVKSLGEIYRETVIHLYDKVGIPDDVLEGIGKKQNNKGKKKPDANSMAKTQTTPFKKNIQVPTTDQSQTYLKASGIKVSNDMGLNTEATASQSLQVANSRVSGGPKRYMRGH